MEDIFGNRKPLTTAEEGWHNEQKRKQYDIIRVSNPTQITVKKVIYDLPPTVKGKPNDMYIMYDVNQYQRVAYNTVIDIPFYQAKLYVKHKLEDMINFINEKKHDEFIADRDRKGLPRYQDKAIENRETYETQEYPKSNDESIIAEVYDQLWLGTVAEFGRDVPPENFNSRSGEVDLTSPEKKAIDNLNKKRVQTNEVPNTINTTPYRPEVIPHAEVKSQFSDLNDKLSVDDITKNE